MFSYNGFTRDELAEVFEFREGRLYYKDSYQSKHLVSRLPRGSLDSDGYLMVGFRRKTFKVHRLHYFLLTGELPSSVDHIDRNTVNNLPGNLRAACVNIQAHNREVYRLNKSGYRGVSWDKARSKWVAYATIDKHRKNLGRYDCKLEAKVAYDKYMLETNPYV